MSFEGFIIDTSVCLVELKSELPIDFFKAMDEISFTTMMGNVECIFLDRIGRVMKKSEFQFVELLFWQCSGKPFIAFFSLLEQWMYWVAIDNDKLWEQVDLLEGENDES